MYGQKNRKISAKKKVQNIIIEYDYRKQVIHFFLFYR